jgi:hypothetical protein
MAVCTPMCMGCSIECAAHLYVFYEELCEYAYLSFNISSIRISTELIANLIHIKAIQYNTIMHAVVSVCVAKSYSTHDVTARLTCMTNALASI